MQSYFYGVIRMTRDDLQRRFLAQHSVAVLEEPFECRNNVATLCWAKNRRRV